MSIGYKGMCKKIFENDEFVIYSYAGENWNDNKSKAGDFKLLDGRILIYKDCLEKPEIHTKTKRMPSGKKKVITKRIIHYPSITKHVLNKKIIIEKECRNAFRMFDFPFDMIADKLLTTIFIKYQEDDFLPESAVFLQ